MMTQRILLAFILCLFAGLLSSASFAEEPDQLLIADMEQSVPWKAFPVNGATPRVELVESTAAAGKRSLRFAGHSDSQSSPSLVFPLEQSLAGYDVLAFDFYCQRHNGARFFVTVHPQGEADKKLNLTAYYGEVDPTLGRDGWTTIRLIKDRSLRKRIPDRADDWDHPRALSFSLNNHGQGEMVFYLDNIRFLKADEAATRNMLFNSSFELAANGDAPDGWRGEIGVPPFGADAWTLDATTAWHEKHSLRMGHAGKVAMAWGRFVNLTPQTNYTFSIYLKSDRPDLRAKLEMNGLNAPNSVEVTVGTEWQRHHLTGVAFRTLTNVMVTQLTEGTLWLDAAQVEEGAEPGPYHWPLLDQQALQQARDNIVQLPPRLNDPPRTARLLALEAAPTLDGRLDDSCWQTPANLTGFRQLETDAPALTATEAWVGYTADALYLALRAHEPDMARVRRMLAGAKNAWTADNVEIFLNLNGDRRSYHQFVINPNGQQWSCHYAAPRARTRWEAPWQGQAVMLDDAWTAEIRIPYTSLNLTEFEGSHLELNVGRTAKLGDERQQVQVSSWVYSHGGFHQPRALGVLEGFDPQVLQPYRLEAPALTWQGGEARARVHNRTSAAVALQCVFEAAGDAPARSAPVQLKLAPEEIGDVHAALPIERDGHYSLRLTATDAAGRPRLTAQPADIKVSGAEIFDFAGPQYDRYFADETAQVRARFTGSAAEAAAAQLRWRLGALHGEVSPQPGVNQWSIPLAALAQGEHELQVTLTRPGHEPLAAQAPVRVIPAAGRMVRIDRWGRFFMREGVPFFPVGFFAESFAKKRSLETWRAVLEDLKRNHCNSVLAYTGMETGLSERLGPYLDVAGEVGIGVWVEISGYFVWHIPKVRSQKNRYFDEATALADLTALLEKHRQHPALLGWCAFDEPGNRPDLLGGAVVLKAARQVRALDPHHPFFCTHLNHMGDAEIYGPGTDLGMMPFLARGGRYDTMFRELWDAGLPVMTNSPCYGAAGGRAGEPTVAEQRVHSWKAVVMGARGLQYYLYRPFSQRLWESMGTFASEIEQLRPWLLTPNDPHPLQLAPAQPDLLATLRSDGRQDLLVVVNTAGGDQEVTVDLLDRAGVTAVEPLFGTGPAQFAPGQPRVRVIVPGEGVVIYRLTTQPAAAVP